MSTETKPNPELNSNQETHQIPFIEKGPTPEEIKEWQEKQMKYMKNQLPFLRLQADYTNLMAKIEENHVRKFEARMKQARYEYEQQKAAMEAKIKEQEALRGNTAAPDKLQVLDKDGN